MARNDGLRKTQQQVCPYLCYIAVFLGPFRRLLAGYVSLSATAEWATLCPQSAIRLQDTFQRFTITLLVCRAGSAGLTRAIHARSRAP